MDGNLAEAQAAFLLKDAPQFVTSRAERIGVFGLGYVGLPVSVALADVFETVIGYDISSERVRALVEGFDATGEVEQSKLMSSPLTVTHVPSDLAACTFYVVAVPTPVDKAHKPDLGPLTATCQLIGPMLNKGDVVVFESTVFPGATEEECGPALEAFSGLKAGRDFHLAYSPERITPGDKTHQLEDVPKIVSGDTDTTLERVAQVYERIVPAGVHRAPSIKVAEAAKVFENTQRDVNIALVNEFSQICEALDLKTQDVLHATGTKWNALPFTPGLVGGHCIGVDPYYLIHKAEAVGAPTQIMRASRTQNDHMARRVTERAISCLQDKQIDLSTARVGVCGVTFKEDVTDTRNSKVLEIIEHLKRAGINPVVNDPLADPLELANRGIELTPLYDMQRLDLLMLAVPHKQYIDKWALQDMLKRHGTLMDLKAVIERPMLRPDIRYWSL